LLNPFYSCPRCWWRSRQRVSPKQWLYIYIYYIELNDTKSRNPLLIVSTDVKSLILRINTLKAYWLYTARLDTKASAILYVQYLRIFCEVRTESLSIIWISVFQSGFREGMSGIPRKTDKFFLAFYMLPFHFYRHILILSSYEYEVTLKKGYYILTGNISERNRWITSEHYKTASFSNSLHLWIWIFAIGYDKN
jgi:hypothetical protein